MGNRIRPKLLRLGKYPLAIGFVTALTVVGAANSECAELTNPAAAGCNVSWSEACTVTRGGWGRMIQLTNGNWLCVTTRFARTNSTLQVQLSTNAARSWQKLGAIAEGHRFMDNGEVIRLPDGAVLLTGRSLIEGESYHLPVYRSTDAGRHWSLWSNIDASDGPVGTMKGRGLWEPHFYFLADGRLAVAYANEKHAADTLAYSQVCSVKASPNLGQSWASEITLAAEPGGGRLRPGMPVVERMSNGRFIAVYEVVGVGDADVFCKFSEDGEHWPEGLGRCIPNHHAGPWVTSLANGRLLLTSCANVISCSGDFGQTWQLTPSAAWEVGVGKNFTWPAICQLDKNEVAVMVAWHGVKLRFGALDH